MTRSVEQLKRRLEDLTDEVESLRGRLASVTLAKASVEKELKQLLLDRSRQLHLFEQDRNVGVSQGAFPRS